MKHSSFDKFVSTAPTGNNMTMDEILSSIRKIISEEENTSNIENPSDVNSDTHLDKREHASVEEQPIKPKSQKEEILSTIAGIKKSLNITDPTPSTETPVINQKIAQKTAPDFLKTFKKNQHSPSETLEESSRVKDEKSYNISNLKKGHSFEETTDSYMELTDIETPTTPEKKLLSPSLKKQNSKISDGLEALLLDSITPLIEKWIEDNIHSVAEKIIKKELYKRKLISEFE